MSSLFVMSDSICLLVLTCLIPFSPPRFPRCVSRFSPRVSFTWSIVWWRGLCFQQEQDKDYKDEATRQKIEDSGLKIHTIAVMGQGGRSGGVVGPGIDMPLISAAYINPDDSVQMARWSR